MAATSAGPYASLHLAPDSTPPVKFFTGRIPVLLPNQQCESTDGKLFVKIGDS